MLTPQGPLPPIAEQISQDEIPTLAVDGPSPLAPPTPEPGPAPDQAAAPNPDLTETAAGKARSATQSETVDYDPGATVAQTKPKKKPEATAPRSKGKPSMPPPTPVAAKAKGPGAPKLPLSPTSNSSSGSVKIPDAVAKKASGRAKAAAADRTDVELIEEIEPMESTEVEAGPSEAEVGDLTDPQIPTPLPDEDADDLLASAPKPADLPPLPSAAGAKAKGPVADVPSSPFDATESVGDVLTKTVAQDGPVSVPASAANVGAPVIDVPAPDAMPDVYTRTVADAEAVAIPKPAAVAGVAPLVPAPSAPSVVVAALASPPPPVASPPPPVASPPPPAGAPAPAMPSAMIPRAPAASVVNSPPPPAAMDAVLGALSAPAPAAMGHAPAAMGQVPGQAPPVVVHTPPPPMNIGPPPDANDHSYPGAALDALAGEEPPMGMGPPNDGRADSGANAVWRQAHPSAQRWAAKRNTGAPRAPRAGVIALGLVLTGFGIYLLALFLPSKAPLTAAKRALIEQQAGVDAGAWRFSEELMTVANVNAGLFVLLGIIVVLRGALHRQSPGQARRKKMDKTSVMLLSCFGLFAMSFLALVLSASVG